MRTGVGAPWALVLICARTTCFAKTGLVGSGGVSGGVSSIAVAQIQVPAANQRRNETMCGIKSLQ